MTIAMFEVSFLIPKNPFCAVDSKSHKAPAVSVPEPRIQKYCNAGLIADDSVVKIVYVTRVK